MDTSNTHSRVFLLLPSVQRSNRFVGERVSLSQRVSQCQRERLGKCVCLSVGFAIGFKPQSEPERIRFCQRIGRGRRRRFIEF
jgi:hypothetical protein